MERTHDVSVCDSSLVELESWIDAARHGDKEALGHALTSVRDYLLLVANEGLEPALRAKGNASDLVQDAFVLAQQGVEKFRGRTAGEWRNWLRKILMRNIAQKRRRFAGTAKRQMQREVAIPDEMQLEYPGHIETPSRDLAHRELEAALIEGLERLSERDRSVVILHQREGLSFEEIGRLCGDSADAVRKRWTRALVRLRRELGPDHDSR